MLENDFLSYYFEAKSITNFAIGYKQVVSPSFHLLAGFRTDFTASNNHNDTFVPNVLSVDQIHIDKYHLTFGPIWKFNRYKLVTGLQSTIGRNKNIYQLINYSDPIEYNPTTDQSLVEDGRTNAETALNEIALFFGLSIDLDN